MILACPKCSARFLIGSNAIGASGRQVRCGRCSHGWFVEAPPAGTLTAAEPDVIAAEPRGAAIEIEPATGTGEAGGAGPEPRDDAAEAARQAALIEAEERRRARIDARRMGKPPPRTGAGGAGLPAIRRPPRRWPARLAWIAVVLVVIGIGGAASHYRDQVIAAWPAAEPLYAAVGVGPPPLGFGLDLVIVRSDQADDNGTPVLTITGRIENKTSVAREVPDLRASLFDERERELRFWTFRAPLHKLPPNQNVGFETELRNPPEDAVRLSIIFHEPR